MQEKGMKFLHQKTQDLKKEIWNSNCNCDCRIHHLAEEKHSL